MYLINSDPKLYSFHKMANDTPENQHANYNYKAQYLYCNKLFAPHIFV